MSEKLAEMAEQQELDSKAVKAQYECDRLVSTKRLAECLEDAKAAWKEAFWVANHRSVASGAGDYTVPPAPEAIAILGFGLYEARFAD